jgi:nucleotidyltransferase substrate binding protein (TIGR01987 family)
MKLDISSLEKATNSLEKAIKEYEKSENEFVRDSCIQRFEYTYELSWKTIKRFLEETAANPNEIDLMSFQELIREANEKGILLTDWETWKLYRIYRGTTSHAYNEDKANEIYNEIPGFLNEIKFLINQLKKHL